MINLSDIFEESVDKTLNGITDYFSKKAENLTNGFVRSFTLSNQEKLTFINDIFVDRCYSISENNSSSAPLHNLDNGAVIAETLKKEPTSYTLNCKFTSIDHEEKYNKLLEIRENGQLITLMYKGKVIENLALLNITRNITNVFYTDFTINLSKLTFVNVSVIPAPKMKKVVSQETTVNVGKEETKSSINSENALKIVDPLGMWVNKGADQLIMEQIGVK